MYDRDSFKFIRFVQNFESNINLLHERHERFNKINEPFNCDIDVLTYFDMLIVQIRAMCIENEKYKDNYTIQVLLQKINKKDDAENINKMLNKYLFAEDIEYNTIEPSEYLSVKKAIKFLADKVICHYDNFDDCPMQKGLIEAITNHLRNPYNCINLDYIIRTIFDCIDKNVTPEILSQLLSEMKKNK